MPEERHAAEEHALLSQVSEPLSVLPPEPPPIAAAPDFPIAMRGYERVAVDDYVRRMSKLLTELRTPHSPDAAVRRALERVGEQIAGILQRAHDTAAEITTSSRREAEDRLIEARREAEEIVAAARARLEDIDAETDRVWAERERIVEEIRGLAHKLLRLGESAATPAGGVGEMELEAGPAPIAAADPDRTAPMPPIFDLEDPEDPDDTQEAGGADEHQDAEHSEGTAEDPDATTLLRRPTDPPA